MAKVLVVDDHAVVRQGLQDILLSIPLVTEVKDAADERQTLEILAQSQSFDTILLDVSLQGGNGIDLLRQIRALYPKQKVLILSMHHEHEYGISALRAGANGYLNKECSAEELKLAVTQMIERGRYISQSLAEVLAETASKPEARLPHELLSERE
jgi:DNA-binding NarL/FixJ family response regulator